MGYNRVKSRQGTTLIESVCLQRMPGQADLWVGEETNLPPVFGKRRGENVSPCTETKKGGN